MFVRENSTMGVQNRDEVANGVSVRYVVLEVSRKCLSEVLVAIPDDFNTNLLFRASLSEAINVAINAQQCEWDEDCRGESTEVEQVEEIPFDKTLGYTVTDISDKLKELIEREEFLRQQYFRKMGGVAKTTK